MFWKILHTGWQSCASPQFRCVGQIDDRESQQNNDWFSNPARDLEIGLTFTGWQI
jgi:hypothetical protein